MAKIIIRDELCNKIEALQYEVESRKDVIAQIVAGSLVMKKESFDAYQNEYKQFFIQYNKAKQEMLDEYNVSNDAMWSLDFNSKELTVVE